MAQAEDKEGVAEAMVVREELADKIVEEIVAEEMVRAAALRDKEEVMALGVDNADEVPDKAAV